MFETIDLIISLHIMYFKWVSSVAVLLSLAFYFSCVLPFTIDQVLGAFGEELTFTIQWIIWAFTVYFGILNFLDVYVPSTNP